MEDGEDCGTLQHGIELKSVGDRGARDALVSDRRRLRPPALEKKYFLYPPRPHAPCHFLLPSNGGQRKRWRPIGPRVASLADKFQDLLPSNPHYTFAPLISGFYLARSPLPPSIPVSHFTLDLRKAGSRR